MAYNFLLPGLRVFQFRNVSRFAGDPEIISPSLDSSRFIPQSPPPPRVEVGEPVERINNGQTKLDSPTYERSNQ